MARALARGGPATRAELAARSGCVERFELPVEHALVLADDSTHAYLGGLAQLTRGMSEAADGVERAFRAGGGVSIEHYGEHFWGELSA